MAARIAVVAGPDAGHAFPCLALAAALRRRGHTLVFASGTEHAAAARSAGATFVELPLLAASGDDEDIGHRLWQRPVEMAPPLVERLRPHRPDLVVADTLTVAGAFAAELLRVPWVELSPHHLTDPSDDIPPVGLGRPPARTPWRRRDDARIRRLQRLSIAAGARQRAVARRALGLPDGGGRPLLRLLATLPGLEYERRDWPPEAHVVGAMEWEPDWEPLPVPPGGRPLVVVTDSTASSVDFSLGALALDALRDLEIRLAVTSTRADLAAWPGAVVGPAPHGPLLDRAAMAVGPGGHGFVGKALVRGVPLVVVPWIGDQRETAGRLRHAGAGIRIPRRLLTGRRLRWSVLRVLHDDRFRSAAGVIARGAQGLGPDHAAGLVESVLHDTTPGRSPGSHVRESDAFSSGARPASN